MSILRTEHIVKDYPGCRALNDVTVCFDSKKVHAFLGKNGSGKSTLVKIFAGAIKPTSGNFYLDDEKLAFDSPSQANDKGIAAVYQEMSLIPSLSVTENIFLGRLPKKNGIIDWKHANEKAKELLSKMGVSIDPQQRVSRLSMWQCQVVEITKALSINPKVIMLDEPTSSLAQNEVELLFDAIRELKKQDVIIIYITHKLHEVPEIADTVTVLRDGIYIGKEDIENINGKKMLQMMFGNVEIKTRPKDVHGTEKVVLEVKDLSLKNKFESVSFQLREGEILGIAGMLGSGRTELLRAIFGADKYTSGSIYINGKKMPKKLSPIIMKNQGVGLTPENRKTDGLIMGQSILENLSFASLERNSRKGFVDRKKKLKAANKQVEELQIKIPDLETFVNALSGGNQQKVVVGNWLNNHPKIMLYDEPSRGIDVNAKQQIFEIMWNGSRNGISTIFVSSELEELLEVCNRIIVMYKGRITGEIDPDEITVNELYDVCMEGKGYEQ